MKYRILAIATFVIALLAAFVPATSASAATPGEFVSDINSLRSSKGLPALTVNSSLSSFAQSWAEKMAAAGGISHNPSLNKAPGNWTTVGENVGVGASEKSIFNALVASSGHYANMVNPKFNNIGVGIAVGADGRIYTTHNFAAYPSSGGSSSETRSAPTTSKPTATSKPATPAPKATTAAAPKTTNASAVNSAPSSSTTQAPAAPATTEAPTTPALPIPSERIVQGLVEVANISTQG